MPKRILWIDNDRVFLRPHRLRLDTEGYMVKQTYILKEGIDDLEKDNYDLVILDIMMPVKEHEEALFPPSITDEGRKSGLIFYKKCINIMKEKRIPVLVFTIREDADIRNGFLDAGLSAKNFMTKSEGADTAVFLAKVKELLAEG